jgi:RND superfamily putative drug exporter
VTALLVFSALPFRNVSPGRIDDRFLPAGNSAREAADQLRKRFYFVEFNPVSILTPTVDPTDTKAVTAAELELLDLPSISRIDSIDGFVTAGGQLAPVPYNDRFAGGPGDGTWFSLTSSAEPDSDRARVLVRDVRALDTEALVTGTTATITDTVDAVLRRVPLALGIVVATTLVLLFLMTGSILVPLKAVVLNLLSLTATFGMLVWVFQEGHLVSWFGVTPTGRIDVFTPVLMFCIAFGLSMDYEIFLLARIKEEYDRTGDNTAAIVRGIDRTGPIVTAAATLLAIVFLCIATSGVVIVKMFGLGLALAVLVDAFLVRATLVPALMKLAGRANWWAPRWLRRIHLRWGIWEREPMSIATTEHGESHD